MNKKEIEKAIKYWKKFKEEIPKLKESYPDAGLDEQEECVDMAISALEKQIAKKPIRHQPTYNFISCPVCNTDLIHTKNYCTYCGQAVDWRNEDE